jgi:hypothetical protein
LEKICQTREGLATVSMEYSKEFTAFENP